MDNKEILEIKADTITQIIIIKIENNIKIMMITIRIMKTVIIEIKMILNIEKTIIIKGITTTIMVIIIIKAIIIKKITQIVIAYKNLT